MDFTASAMFNHALSEMGKSHGHGVCAGQSGLWFFQNKPQRGESSIEWQALMDRGQSPRIFELTELHSHGTTTYYAERDDFIGGKSKPRPVMGPWSGQGEPRSFPDLRPVF